MRGHQQSDALSTGNGTDIPIDSTGCANADGLRNGQPTSSDLDAEADMGFPLLADHSRASYL